MEEPLKTVVIGLFGARLDAGSEDRRWNRWRPTVDLCRQDDLIIDRFELLFEAKSERAAGTVRDDIAAVSPETEVRLHPVEMKKPWDFESVFDELHAFVAAYPFDVEAENYLVHITTGTHVAQICWFLLTESRHIPARLLQSAPPRRNPADPGSYATIDLDLSRYDRIATRFDHELAQTLSFLKSGIETRNEAFNGLMEQIELVAVSSQAPILLTGPTGAGKSRLARRIYELKASKHLVSGRFVEVNCATIRGDGAMSTLFGHRRGAFTGAAADRRGLLRAADQGVLFLDELAELGLDEQAMLLRAIEEKRFLPVGSDKEEESDFQLITGTNRELRAAVREGRFREDLLARLDLWNFRLPGLRHRHEDIEPNLDYELARAVRSTGRKITMTSEARRDFLRFATSPMATWNANFRDLNAAVTRMATLAPSGRITGAQVRDEIARLETAWQQPDTGLATDLASGLGAGLATVQGTNAALLIQALGAEDARLLDRFDAVQLADVLAVCRRHRSLSAAGRELFAQSRRRKKSVNDADRLRKYLARFELDWQKIEELASRR